MSFLPALDRIRRWQRLGRLVAAVILTLATGSMLLLLLGLADAWWGFETNVRPTLVTALLGGTGLLFLALVGVALRFSRFRSARFADHLTGNPRCPASASLSLSAERPQIPLAGYLTERSLDEAATTLRGLQARRIIPWKSIGTSTAIVVICLLPLGILRLTQPGAFATIAHRLVHPSSDLPPWSPLDFTLDPPAPECLYGGELTVSVEITGGALEHPVDCLVRRADGSEVQRLPAFRESESRFSRTLEGLTEPVVIAFSCGRARSGWHPVELLLQPKVLAGRVTIAPPAYTERPAVSTPLDSNEIAALEGSEVTLELTSNRPLARSTLTFTPATAPGVEAVPQEIEGELTASDTIAFQWTAARAGTIAIELRDVRGTPSATPLELKLRAVPDQAPAVELLSPPRLLLATPTTRIPLKGEAEDDHALSRVQFVRTLQGFRDRARVVAPALRQKQYEFRDAMELGTVGVVPGQVIELFLEAADHNPSLLGQGASEISRIQIISEDDYAYRIRAKTTLEQFSARFRAISETLREARESLEEMDKAANLNDAEAAEAARRKARDAHQRAAELLDRLANDFPAFEVEDRLKELAAENASAARQNLEALDAFDPKANESVQRGAIREMLDRIGRGQPELDQLQADARLLAEAGKLLEMAARFQQIHANQESVTRRIHTIAKEISKGEDGNRRLLPSLAETQRKNREALDRFAMELRQRAESIRDPALAPLRDSSLAFLDRLALSDPGSVMDLASDSARLGQANDAFVSAELARSLLENLLSASNPFCDACRGQCMGFPNFRPDVNATMRQLLQGLMCQNPGSEPNDGIGAGGMGMGGFGPSGSAQPGFAALDIPVLGPERMFFTPLSTGARAEGNGQGGRGPGPDEAAETETMKPAEDRHDTEATPDLDSVPASYRDAVKAYFTPEE